MGDLNNKVAGSETKTGKQNQSLPETYMDIHAVTAITSVV